MAATGVTISDVQAEAIGIRCPIGDCKTVLADPFQGSDVVAGHAYLVSNMLLFALEDRDGAGPVGNCEVTCAYEIPKLQLSNARPSKIRAVDALLIGHRLGYNAGSDLFCIKTALYATVGHVLEAKAANASEVLIHFIGNIEADYIAST